MKIDFNLKTFGERFQVLCLYLTEIIEKLIMVCTSCESTLGFPLLVPREHFLCERGHSIIILAEFWQNASKISLIQPF